MRIRMAACRGDIGGCGAACEFPGAGCVAEGGCDVAVAGGTGAPDCVTAETADWHAGDSLPRLFCRHCKDAAPPAGTLAQFAS
jgi:hypothetical protein